ncbi:MAG: RNA polymerase sigma factor [Opitutaceae bacterium]|nr:RNA polymerase sigma factor [Opitutaceae bacterium]
MNPADADLQALQRGDESALSRLIERWRRPLFAFAWRYVRNSADANELVAEVFVRLYRQSMRLSADTNLPAWLFTVLANLCRNHHRRERRSPLVHLEAPTGAEPGTDVVADSIAVDRPGPDRILEHDEALAALAAAIDRLPHELKVPLLLHHYERMDYATLGPILGCSARGVETRLYRARQYLRAELAGFLRETVGS